MTYVWTGAWLHTKIKFLSGWGPMAFPRFGWFCPDWLLAVFKISPKSVQIGIRAIMLLCRHAVGKLLASQWWLWAQPVKLITLCWWSWVCIRKIGGQDFEEGPVASCNKHPISGNYIPGHPPQNKLYYEDISFITCNKGKGLATLKWKAMAVLSPKKKAWGFWDWGKINIPQSCP